MAAIIGALVFIVGVALYWARRTTYLRLGLAVACLASAAILVIGVATNSHVHTSTEADHATWPLDTPVPAG
jgi:hypothetical protein